MFAITIPAPGGPEALRWAQVDDPEPGPGEALVEVAATAVNRADLLQRQGFYPPPPGASPLLGLECSGRIVGFGKGAAEVSPWSVGDEVCALLAGGGYAELVAVPIGQLMPKPRGLDLVAAASLPEVACTVWSMVGDVGHLAAGEAFLVHGGSGGIGTFAIQFARARGATVLTTAGSPAKLDKCRELGASVLIPYNEADFLDRARAATGDRGVDVILDNMGGAYLARNLEALAVGGRLIVIGLQGGASGELDLGGLLMKRASVHAASLRARPEGEKAAICTAVAREVWTLVAEKRIVPVIDRVLPMAEAAEAHRVVEAGEQVGKVVLAAPGFISAAG